MADFIIQLNVGLGDDVEITNADSNGPTLEGGFLTFRQSGAQTVVLAKFRADSVISAINKAQQKQP